MQTGPALFAWDGLTPRSSTTTTMSQVAVPFPVATARQAFEEDVPIPDAGPAEVPWRPDPDLALEGSSNGGDPTTGPEHGVPTPPRDAEEVDERRRWYALGALAIILALAIFVAYMAVGNRTRQAEPAPRASSAASAAPTPTSDPSGATASQTPMSTSSASASPSPSSTAASDTLDLGDASLKVLPGWQVYADEVVQDNRRLVRLKRGDSDSRIQIVTLTSLSGDLKQACADLTTEHRQAYSDVAESATVNVAVADGATGVACGFTGTRTSDKVPVKVDFTIVQRADKTSIVFRDVIPQSVAADSPIRGELATMECGAANSFGVKITQCASVGKADG